MKSIEDRIDDKVSDWHSGAGGEKPLHEYLGWTFDEYRHWVVSCEIPARERADLVLNVTESEYDEIKETSYERAKVSGREHPDGNDAMAAIQAVLGREVHDALDNHVFGIVVVAATPENMNQRIVDGVRV